MSGGGLIVTPFGTLSLGDGKALRAWLAAHARRHHLESKVTGLPGGNLDAPIDGDWFYRHWARHVALATYRKLDLQGMTGGLALPHIWQTEGEMSVWHDLHNRIHFRQDRQLKLS